MGTTLQERFDAKWCPEPNSGCWLWTAAVNPKGYGVINAGARNYLAHRLAWITANGEVPEGMRVCHKCDTPSCVNPEHLFLGTDLDNSRDMCKKQRQARGTRNGHAKLTPEDVLDIRRRYVPGNGASLGREYGITQMSISDIVCGHNWKHLLP